MIRPFPLALFASSRSASESVSTFRDLLRATSTSLWSTAIVARDADAAAELEGRLEALDLVDAAISVREATAPVELPNSLTGRASSTAPAVSVPTVTGAAEASVSLLEPGSVKSSRCTPCRMQSCSPLQPFTRVTELDRIIAR